MPTRLDRAIAAFAVVALCACSTRPARDLPDPVPVPVPSSIPPPRTDPSVVVEEQEARRARSITRLVAEGVPVLESLPVVEAEAQCRFRSKDEVVDRAIALLAVASRGAGDPPDAVDTFARSFGATAHLSPRERAFFDDANPNPTEASALSWRFESVVVLLWALGYRDRLGPPTAPVNGSEIVEAFVSRGPAAFRAQARLRSGGELLDEADLIYRYDWATTDARVNGGPPPQNVSPDVVMERHQALNWLIGYRGAAWDDVPTDT